MGIIMQVLQLLPALIAAIKAVEDAIPGSGKGEQKLEAIRQILITVDDSVGAIWPKIQAVIGVVVNLLNTTGVFKK